MNIRYYEKRPGSWWLDFRTEGGERKRVPSGCATQGAAERAAPRVIAEALRGPLPATVPPQGPRPAKAEAAGVTLRQAFELASRTRESWITSKDRGSMETTMGQLGVNEGTDMGAFTRDYVRGLRERWLKEPGKRQGSTLSASTINHRLSLLSVLLEVCDLTPHTVKHLSTKGNSRRRRFTDAEMDAARSWCYAHASTRKGALDLADLITVGIGTGAREGELLGLKWSEVAVDTLTFLDTKNGLSRTIPLRPAVKALLGARRALPAPFSGLTSDRVTDLWSQMRSALGLAADHAFVFHLLRHESVQRMIDDGASTLAVMAWHGHESVATTEGYATIGLAAMRRAAGMTNNLKEAA